MKRVYEKELIVELETKLRALEYRFNTCTNKLKSMSLMQDIVKGKQKLIELKNEVKNANNN